MSLPKCKSMYLIMCKYCSIPFALEKKKEIER